MTGLRREQRPRSFDDGLQQLLEGVRARDRLRKFRQLLELGDAELRPRSARSRSRSRRVMPTLRGSRPRRPRTRVVPRCGP